MMSETIENRDWNGNTIPITGIGKCIGCGEVATRTNNTLCQNCWYDCEGENE